MLHENIELYAVNNIISVAVCPAHSEIASPASALSKLVSTVCCQLGMSEKRKYAIAAYLALCRIFRIFQQSVHMAYFSAYFGIFGGIKYSL